MFNDPAWKGAAYYRAGNFDEAARFIKDAEGIENTYNLGNALARKGQYEQAISLYNEVLTQNPDHEDARHNKDLLEKELQQQQQESSNNENRGQPEQQQQNQDQDERQQEQATRQIEQQEEDNQNQQSQETEKESDPEEQQQQEEEQDTTEPEPSLANNDQADEKEQATEQWLRRIPDDPGGLLRRKFLMQYQQRKRNRVPGEKLW